jgi:glycosyltransferase involved in cell wall biosynthesis
MPYRIETRELSSLDTPINLTTEQDGWALVLRRKGRLCGFLMQPAAPGATISGEDVRKQVTKLLGSRLQAQAIEAALRAREMPTEEPPAPSLSVAICTKDRAQRLGRLLDSLLPLRSGSRFASVEILVVDNASVDDATRLAAQARPGVRYVHEPLIGLDFARNAAIAAATGEYLAYLDDDVVVDQGWLDGLHAAWRDAPDAGGFSGLVLPYRLDTEAQIHFEANGGFGRGFARIDHRAAQSDNRLHPVGAGIVGAGCNMCFRRDLLISLGGFDEALDTGGPLPGGGDLDIFYRVLRSGHAIVYEPRYAVYHEHRETLEQLQRQYWSWGLGFMAFLVKSWRADPAMHGRQRRMVAWWFKDKSRALLRAVLRRQARERRFLWAEFKGGVEGLLGEYDRSLARVQAIRDAAR